MEERYPRQKCPQQGCHGDFSRPHSQHPAPPRLPRDCRPDVCPRPSLREARAHTHTCAPRRPVGEESGRGWAGGRVESRCPGGGRRGRGWSRPAAPGRGSHLAPSGRRLAGLDLPASAPASPLPSQRRPSAFQGSVLGPSCPQSRGLCPGSAGSGAQWWTSLGALCRHHRYVPVFGHCQGHCTRSQVSLGGDGTPAGRHLGVGGPSPVLGSHCRGEAGGPDGAAWAPEESGGRRSGGPGPRDPRVASVSRLRAALHSPLATLESVMRARERGGGWRERERKRERER